MVPYSHLHVSLAAMKLTIQDGRLFTVSLHSLDSRQIALPSGLCKVIVHGLWKTVEIQIGYMNPQSIVIEVISPYM